MAASAARIAEVLAGLRAESARLNAAAARPALAPLPIGPGEPGQADALYASAFDRSLGGGLPRGRVTELVGPRSSGRLSLAVAALEAAVAARELGAIVDPADAFDPRSAAAGGLALEQVLWVRPRGLLDALKAADRILDAGGFAVVVLYLCGLRPRAGLDPAWARLQRRAERSRAVALVVADEPLTGGVAAVSLRTLRARARWLGGAHGPQLLDGSDGAVELTRSRLGSPQAPVGLSFARARA